MSLKFSHSLIVWIPLLPTFSAMLWSLPASSEPLPIDIPPQIQSSPTLKKWRRSLPNIRQDINNDPSFKPRIRLGYTRFSPSNTHGLSLGLEDLRIGRTPVTLSASYSYSPTVSTWGIDVQPYICPLGGYMNVAPVIGIRSLSTSTIQTTEFNLGARLLLVPSRGGGADVTLQQTWMAIGTDREIGIGKISVGYAIAPKLRIATDLERWHGRSIGETRASLLLEWMP